MLVICLAFRCGRAAAAGHYFGNPVALCTSNEGCDARSHLLQSAPIRAGGIAANSRTVYDIQIP